MYSRWERITERQRSAVFDWCQFHGVELPEQLQPNYDPETVVA
jgi:hypothetical protein